MPAKRRWAFHGQSAKPGEFDQNAVPDFKNFFGRILDRTRHSSNKIKLRSDPEAQ